jgi:SAM-dependent methyltransferase
MTSDAATVTETAGGAAKAADGEPFRFFDNREKYLLFVTTTSEKAVVAARIGKELDLLKPTPPALRVFDAGTGNGIVLANVLRDLHRRMPTVPFVVVGKEVSMEDTRLTLSTLPGRFSEHPETVVVLTNMFYAEAPDLFPRNPEAQAQVQWWEVGLDGTTSFEFQQQVGNLENVLAEGWQTKSSPKTGNPVYAKPSVLVLYRSDRAFALHDLVPRNIGAAQDFKYDLVLAAQPYRSRTPAEPKVKMVLAPIARALAPNGRLVVVQSTGHDPGMEIVRRIWPDDEPFATPRHMLIKELDRQLNAEGADFHFEHADDAQALFTYNLHAMPNEVTNRLTTSTALAAWNAAVYVAQIDDERVAKAMQEGNYLGVTNDVVLKHGGLWFQDESFVVVRN